MYSELESGRILRSAFSKADFDDPVSYFGRASDIFDALSFAWLFWPKLVELYGAVFFALDGNDEREIDKRLHTAFGDAHPEWPAMPWKHAVNSYNRFEVAHLFYVCREPSSLISRAAKELSHFLVQTWQARLRWEYPERIFSVQVAEPDDSTELSIEVCQKSPDLEVPDGWNEQRRCIELPRR
ncbi:MAG: hypothetical protein DLM55_04580 [Acidimicrobiales bacterium]|nr:MAG: hypothetical protein DLM55_04580 [Acidimicrobiales bacterium]